MPLLTCSACSGKGWVSKVDQPHAMCSKCAGLGSLLGSLNLEHLVELPRWSPMHVRRWRRGARLASGDWEWHLVRDYADASVCHLMEDHPWLPGWQVELAAYDDDPASDLYPDDVRPFLERGSDGYLWLFGDRPVIKEHAVQEWHRSYGLGHERYYVQLAHLDLDEALVTTFEIWDMQHHGHPFPQRESTIDDLPAA